MQLLQIGVPQRKTILDFIHELSERQAHEMEELKRSAIERAGRKRHRARKSYT
jgi:hypothetical protein